MYAYVLLFVLFVVLFVYGVPRICFLAADTQKIAGAVNPQSKDLDFAGFDSSRLSVLEGGNSQVHRELPRN